MNTISLFNPGSWGIPIEAVEQLGNRLEDFWAGYQECFKSKTRDVNESGYHYMSGQLRMESDRNFANIGRNTGVSGQNMQHFMSNSPWSSQRVYQKIQQDIKATPGLESGGVLLLDESGDEKAGVHSAGSSKQYNGRLGKIEISQMGVFLAYANLKTTPVWSWVEGDLFLPEVWFSEENAQLRKRLGIPKDLKFKSKIEIGWELIQRVRDNGLPFEILGCDSLYGRSEWLRSQLHENGITYMAEIACDTQVYLNQPTLGIPDRASNKGRFPTRVKVLSQERAVEVRSLVNAKNTQWHRLKIRTIERGELCDLFAARRVWVVYEDQVREEWLVIRQESNGKYSYAFSNAGADTSLVQLAWWKCQRYFVERANQDAKSEMGWDEFQAQKYLAWQHHLALTILACWFIAQTKFEWAKKYPQNPQLLEQFEIDVLPLLSVANIRTLLRAVMPLSQLTPEQASQLVVEHLVNRTRSRKSRLRKARDGDIQTEM